MARNKSSFRGKTEWVPYPVRRGQLVAPFGVGAMVDFPGESLMVAGLDAWPAHSPEVRDERLAARLGVATFKTPPAPPEQEGDLGGFIPAIRFPLWHQCPVCKSLQKCGWNDWIAPRCARCKNKFRAVPLRFVTACEGGHIDDFPWVAWAHRKDGQMLRDVQSCPEPRLRLDSSGRAGLDGLWLKCEACGTPARSLAGAGRESGLPGHDCSGNRPWLGPNARVTCSGKAVRMVQRGASNVYFGNVASSILIPPYASRYYEIVNNADHWHNLTHGVDPKENPPADRLDLLLANPKYRGLNPARLLEMIRKKREGKLTPSADESEVQYRLAEYRALREKNSIHDEQFSATRLDETKLHSSVRGFFGDLVRVERLAETRALIGLSRLIPPDGESFPATAEKRELALRYTDWLPATRVYGEGIFFSLNPEKVKNWSLLNAVKARTSRLTKRYNDVQALRGRHSRVLLPKFYLLHTLAHTLIRQLSFECGYGSSALRERIYCDDDTIAEGMCGVLIYTAAGDCEGTLGGLVRQAEAADFSHLVRDAVSSLRWCSSDPLCIEAEAQGADGLNMAACHACVLLPETSCEEGNRLLDRALLVGTEKNPELGFFTALVDELTR